MRTIKAAFAVAIIGLLFSLSMATAAGQYPPSNPPDNNPNPTVQTQVAGIQETSDNSGNLAFTGRSIGETAALGAGLVVIGGAVWFVSQRRRPETR